MRILSRRQKMNTIKAYKMTKTYVLERLLDTGKVEGREAGRSEAVKLSKIKNIVFLVQGQNLNVAEIAKKQCWSYKGGEGSR